MKFLVDAQLPRRVALRLVERGNDAVHTLDLPKGNRTSDAELNALSVSDERVLVTKDHDFVQIFVLHRVPWKLLLVSTGNISNQELGQLVLSNLNAIIDGFATSGFIELDRTNIIVHS